MKEIVCGDLVPGCHHRIHAESEAELLRKMSEHMREAHPDVTLTPAMIGAAKEKSHETS